jgi:hypothetical protein
VNQVTSARRFVRERLGKAEFMTTATLDLAPQSEPAQATAAPSTPDERRVAATLRRATDDAANAARHRRQDRIAFGALIFGLVISLGTFGLVAYDNSVSQGTPASVSTTP